MKTFTFVSVAAVVLFAAAIAEAQRGAGSKISGSAYEYPYFYSSAGVYHDTAWQHADVLREAASYGEPVPQDIAKEHTTAIRQSVQAAGKKYTALRKLAGDHKAVNKHLDVIAEHHKKVLAACDEIDGHCAKGPGDPKKVAASSHEAAASLKSAQAEHEKLMQHFEAPQAKK